MSTTVINNIMPANVPKLKQSGVNWVIFQLRFQTAVQGKGLWSHFDGSTPKLMLKLPSVTVSPPSASSSGSVSCAKTSLDFSDASPIAPILLGTTGEILEWEHHENIAHSLLVQQLLNLMLIVVDSQPTVAKMWEAVVKEYTYKGAFSQTHMHQAFLSTCCPRGGDVHNFLADLHAHHAELDAVGISINNNNCRSTILQSLPLSLSNFTSMQLSAACLTVTFGSSGTIDPDLLIIMVSNEWEQTQSYSHSCGKDNLPVDNALSVEGDGKWKGKGKKKGPCWKCGGPHMRQECPELEEKGDEVKVKSESSKSGESANVMASTWDDDNAAFTVEAADDNILTMDDIGSYSNRFEVELEVDIGTSEIEQDLFGKDEGEFAGEPENAWELSVSDDGGNWEVYDTLTLGLQAQVADNISAADLSHECEESVACIEVLKPGSDVVITKSALIERGIGSNLGKAHPSSVIRMTIPCSFNNNGDGFDSNNGTPCVGSLTTLVKPVVTSTVLDISQAPDFDGASNSFPPPKFDVVNGSGSGDGEVTKTMKIEGESMVEDKEQAWEYDKMPFDGIDPAASKLKWGLAIKANVDGTMHHETH
ncbi:hypothetical protein AN958_12673 [Leucoagaricus sp. SymC.cos]|nr:hypothetical protein AN958_12673 [Leucoagaricus sp. SymC.cos]